MKAELAEKKYKDLVSRLKKTPDTLTPEVQEIVTKETVHETQTSAKSLHSAVSKMEKAQKALDAAQGARHQLHSRWRSFVTAAIPRWRKWAEDYQKEDKELAEKIAESKRVLESVKTEYEQQNSMFGLKAVAAPIEITSDDEGKMESAAEKVNQSVNGMLSSLEQIKSTADELYDEEQKAAKRPRTEDANVYQPMDGVQSFGAPGSGGP